MVLLADFSQSDDAIQNILVSDCKEEPAFFRKKINLFIQWEKRLPQRELQETVNSQPREEYTLFLKVNITVYIITCEYTCKYLKVGRHTIN